MEHPVYNLIQAVNPNNIVIPIRDRFEKLTLSSNKKKNVIKNPTPEKRHSASRNLLSQLSNAVGDDKENDNSSEAHHECNPILRSESSKSLQPSSEYTMMEALYMTEDEDENESPGAGTEVKLEKIGDLDLLSQAFANGCRFVDKAISVSTASNDNRNEQNSVGDERLLENEKELENEEEEYDDDDDDDDRPITIPDSSSDSIENENVMAISAVPLVDEPIITDSISNHKAQQLQAFLQDCKHLVQQRQNQMNLQETMDNSDDVSQLHYDDSENSSLKNEKINERATATADTESVTEQENIVAINTKQERNTNLYNPAKLLAQADTESMTPEENDDELIVQQNIQQERLKRLGILSSPEKKSSAAQKLDDTVPNTIADTDETYYDGENANMQQKSSMKLAETLPNTEVSIMEDEDVKRSSRYKTPKKPFHAAETMSNSDSAETISNTEECITEEQNVKSTSETEPNTNLAETISNTQEKSRIEQENNKYTPQKSSEPLHAAETEANTEIDSLILSDTDNDDDSHVSFKSQNQSIPQQEEEIIINSSSENIVFNTKPNESFTILETDEEAESENVSSLESNSCKKYQSPAQSNNTSSVETDSPCSEMQAIQMSMASINISAKINIKIHIPNDSTESSDVDSDKLSSNDGDSNKQQRQSLQSNVERSFSQQMQRQQQPALTNNDESFGETNLKSAPANDDVDFLTQSEKLLNQLYGESWQTPDVLRTLKKTSATDFKKETKQKLEYSDKENTPFKMPINLPKNKESAKKILETTAKKQKPAPAKKPRDTSLNNNREVEESVLLDDFSMFRNNIVNTNLDSTRLTKKPNLSDKPASDKNITPKIRRAKAAALAKRWQHLIDTDSESEGDNASDDEDAVVTDDDEDELQNNRKKSNHRNLSAEDIYKSDDNQIVYLDLTKDKVEILNSSTDSPPANHDAVFAERLQNILKSCTPAIKPKLSATPTNKKSKRKLFTPTFGDEEELLQNLNDSALRQSIAKNINIIGKNNKHNEEETVVDDFISPFDGKIMDIQNKKLESVKTGKPIFAITPPSLKTKQSKDTPSKTAAVKTPKSVRKNANDTPLVSATKTKRAQKHAELSNTPNYKYGFLKSLDPAVSKSFCHSDALYYRDNYRTKRVELSQILYDMYNEKLFKNKLNVPLQWNKKLTNTAGRCLNKKRLGTRSSLVELSEKVLTSADRLRCTLIHEMCHAATWIFNGEGGHGATWKQWASQANAIFPEIPKIGVCHQYEIQYKYTYKCTLCAAKSHAHSKSKKVENIRCSYCHGAIEIFFNKKDKDGNIIPTPVREPTGFAKFVQDNYKKFKNDKLKHADVMKLLSNEFASMKIGGGAATKTN